MLRRSRARRGRAITLRDVANEYAFEMAASNVRFGAGVTREVGEDLRDLGLRRVLVVTDPVVAQLAPVQVVLQALADADIEAVVYDRVRVEPTDISFKDAIAFARDAHVDGYVAVGGGSRSDYWLSAIATALGVPVMLPQAGDFGGAFGAARLAMMAATGAGAEIATLPPIARVIEPDTALSDAFDAGHARYRAAQSAIRGLT